MAGPFDGQAQWRHHLLRHRGSPWGLILVAVRRRRHLRVRVGGRDGPCSVSSVSLAIPGGFRHISRRLWCPGSWEAFVFLLILR